MATKKTNTTKSAPKEAEKKTNQTETQPEATDTPQYRVPFIKARIDNLVDFEGSKTKAFASVTIGNHFAAHGFRVVENGEGGYDVLDPATQGKDGKYRADFHAVTKEGREALHGYILDAYEQKLAETESEDQTATEDEVVDEDHALGQSM